VSQSAVTLLPRASSEPVLSSLITVIASQRLPRPARFTLLNEDRRHAAADAPGRVLARR